MPEHVDYERRDLGARRVIVALASFLGTMVAAAGVMWILLTAIQPTAKPHAPSLAETRAPPRTGPPLVVDTNADRDQAAADFKRQLDAFGWADRDHGMARIPAGEALKLLGQRGWDAAPGQRVGQPPAPGR